MPQFIEATRLTRWRVPRAGVDLRGAGRGLVPGAGHRRREIARRFPAPAVHGQRAQQGRGRHVHRAGLEARHRASVLRLASQLKDQFGASAPRAIAGMIRAVHADFPHDAFFANRSRVRRAVAHRPRVSHRLGIAHPFAAGLPRRSRRAAGVGIAASRSSCLGGMAAFSTCRTCSSWRGTGSIISRIRCARSTL